jgi:hypothetical protein
MRYVMPELNRWKESRKTDHVKRHVGTIWKVCGRRELPVDELVFTSAGAILTTINTRDFHLSNSD